ncbi:hypothetical protein [Geodermatophilus sp. URMC 63]
MTRAACRLLLVAALLVPAVPAQAAWSVPGSGTGAARAGKLVSAAAPSVTGSGPATSRTFTVTWPVPPAGGVPVTGWQVTRDSSLLGAGLVSSGTCAGSSANGVPGVAHPASDGTRLSCTDVATVSVGTVRYTVTPVNVRWVGPPSPWSPATA